MLGYPARTGTRRLRFVETPKSQSQLSNSLSLVGRQDRSADSGGVGKLSLQLRTLA